MSFLPLKEPPGSLCILRMSAIGDTTHVVPVVRTLQRHWPDCKLTWIIGAVEHGLLRNLDGVEFVVVDKRGGPAEKRRLRETLAGRRFDVLLHMQAALRASLLARRIPAPIKLGFDRQRAVDYQWLFTNQRIEAAPRQHVLDGFFGFLEALGLQERELRWDLPLEPQDVEWARGVGDTDAPLLVINPCSSLRRNNWRNWPIEHYAPVIEHARGLGLHVVLTGGPAAEERAMGAALRAASSEGVTNLVGETSLQQLLALIARARAMIAPDTGPAHMATMVGVPAIGLFASSNPARTGPYLSREYTVDKYPEALERFLGKRVDEVKWGRRVRDPHVMELIGIGEVIAALDAALSR